jgi:hypothetical protein
MKLAGRENLVIFYLALALRQIPDKVIDLGPVLHQSPLGDEEQPDKPST